MSAFKAALEAFKNAVTPELDFTESVVPERANL